MMRKFHFSTLITAGVLTPRVPALANKLDVPIFKHGYGHGPKGQGVAEG
jgi:hypothetical protein